jgi:hypothetical protein
MTTFIPFTPEPATDVIAAYHQGRYLSIGVEISPDSLGPVNRIVTLIKGNRRIKSALALVLPTSSVEVIRDYGSGTYTLTELFALKDSWLNPPPPHPEPYRPAGFHVEIDGHTVLTATDAEIWPLPVIPTPPWRERTRRAVRKAVQARARKVGDRIAARFGYVHGSEAGW